MDLFAGRVYRLTDSSGLSAYVQPFVGVSHYPLPAGTVIDTWISPNEHHIDKDHGVKPESIDHIRIGGQAARLETYHVADGTNVYTAYVAEVVHGRAGYTIECLYAQPVTMTDMSTFDRQQRALFERMLASLAFR